MGAAGPIDKGCIFCRIISAEISARIVSESQTAIAFMDAFPLALGHTLVVPKAHRRRMQDMTAEETAGVFLMAADLIRRTDRMAGATLLAIHNGREAGQEVPHVHLHLVPRREGDSAGPIHSMFPKASFTESQMKETHDILRD